MPRGKYDWLEVQAFMPTTGMAQAAEISWQLQQDGTLVPSCYRITNNTRTKMKADTDGSCVAEPEVELQQSFSDTSISLSH